MSRELVKRKRRRQKAKGKSAEGADEALKVWPEKIIGLKYVRLLEKQLDQLRKESAHGNQQLFLDDVFVAYLLAFFNPTVRSLRTIEDLSQTQQLQKHLTIRKICKSTLSDFNQLVAPERLTPIIQALRLELNRKQIGQRNNDSDLNKLLNQTIAVDGTFLPAVAKVAWAVGHANTHAVRHRARLDASVNVMTWLPEAIVVPDPGQSESDSAIETIQAGRIYVYDRGYTGFALLKAHFEQVDDALEVKSHFVVRYKTGATSPTLQDAVDRPLDEEDRAAGITSDRVGYFTSVSARGANVSKILFREVVIPYDDNGEPKTLRLITNLLDVSANTIAVLYKNRWQVELFFRWLKSIGNLGHLISHSSEGVQAHIYVTIIAVLLMYTHTGYRPSKYMFALLNQVAMGAATLDEIMPILRERERRSALDRASAARRRAKKKAEGK
jgi:hypothetical protein